MKAIRIHQTGGPEVLTLEDIAQPEPGPGELRIRHSAIGVNFIDTYLRSGLYPVRLPAIVGQEAAGIVDAVGAGVGGWRPGDRAAYCLGTLGAYAEANCIPAQEAVRLPEEVDEDVAAAGLLKGLTAQYLLRQIYQVKTGDTILFHAAAGGVGLIACQWAKHLGARVIGTVGSPEKGALARAHGCDEIIHYREEDVAARVRELTGGEGVPVVFDGVGQSTFEASLNSLRKKGLLVSFGNASGAVTGVNLGILAQKGSLFVTRPTLAHYAGPPDALAAAARDLFAVVASGAVKIEIHQRRLLTEAADVHRDLEARKTTGATILLP